MIAIYHTDGQNYDAIVYGYAFRDHWHWYNGIKFNDGYYASIFLWKDYNCQKWWSYAQYNANDFLYYSYDYSFYTSALTPIVNSVNSNTASSDNIWQVAYNLGYALETNPNTKKNAFTVIASQSPNSIFNGYFCAKDYAELVDSNGFPILYGGTFAIQTR